MGKGGIRGADYRLCKRASAVGHQPSNAQIFGRKVTAGLHLLRIRREETAFDYAACKSTAYSRFLGIPHSGPLRAGWRNPLYAVNIGRALKYFLINPS